MTTIRQHHEAYSYDGRAPLVLGANGQIGLWTEEGPNGTIYVGDANETPHSDCADCDALEMAREWLACFPEPTLRAFNADVTRLPIYLHW